MKVGDLVRLLGDDIRLANNQDEVIRAGAVGLIATNGTPHWPPVVNGQVWVRWLGHQYSIPRLMMARDIEVISESR